MVYWRPRGEEAVVGPGSGDVCFAAGGWEECSYLQTDCLSGLSLSGADSSEASYST